MLASHPPPQTQQAASGKSSAPVSNPSRATQPPRARPKRAIIGKRTAVAAIGR
jgi:hypothetical protein